MGYIIAGTFLVAAINENSPAWAGSGAWVLAGLAAIPASAAWSHLSRRWARPTLLCAALLIQAAGIALPALVSGVAPALVSAVLFGATFLGVASMALALGVQLRYPRAVALLTTGYGLGQILGPLVVTPLLHHGYHLALLIAAAIVLAAALAAAVLRIGTGLPGTRPDPRVSRRRRRTGCADRSSRWTGSLANTRRRYRSPLGPHPFIGVAATSDRVNSRCDASPADSPMLAQSMSSDHPPSGRRHG